MNELMQKYRTLFADNPAKAEKQLYKLAKKGDLQALSALNEYYERCATEAKTAKESSKIRQKALKAALLGAAQNSPYWLIWVGEMYRYGVGTEKNEDVYKRQALPCVPYPISSRRAPYTC